MVAGEARWHATVFSDLVIAILSLRLDKETSGFLFLNWFGDSENQGQQVLKK